MGGLIDEKKGEGRNGGRTGATGQGVPTRRGVSQKTREGTERQKCAKEGTMGTEAAVTINSN